MKKILLIIGLSILILSLSCDLAALFGLKPSQRFAQAMAYIGNNKIIMFGGTKDAVTGFNDTWEFDTAAGVWTELEIPGAVPGPAWHHAMAPLGNNKVLFFGGYIDGDFNNDTWEFDYTAMTWKKIVTITAPSARVAMAMEYIGDSKVLLFGGTDGGGETWEYNGNTGTWRYISTPILHPSDRYGHDDMVYLAQENRVVMFGGDSFDSLCNCGRQLNDTWEFNTLDETWTEVTVDSSKPSPPREHIAMAYAGGAKILVHGGTYYSAGKFPGSYQELLDDMWEFDFNTKAWTLVTISGKKPGKVNAHAMEYTGNDQIFMYDGSVMWLFNITARSWSLAE